MQLLAIAPHSLWRNDSIFLWRPPPEQHSIFPVGFAVFIRVKRAVLASVTKANRFYVGTTSLLTAGVRILTSTGSLHARGSLGIFRTCMRF